MCFSTTQMHHVGVHIVSASRGARGRSWAPNAHNMTLGASGGLVARYGARVVAVTMENVSLGHAPISPRYGCTTACMGRPPAAFCAPHAPYMSSLSTCGPWEGGWACILVPSMHQRATIMQAKYVLLDNTNAPCGGAHYERVTRRPRASLGSKSPQHDPRS